MSRCLIKVGTGRLSETSGGCAGHGFPLRHCADPMDVDGEDRVFLVRGGEEISECLKDRYEPLQAADGSKSLHHPLPFSKRHVRILGPIVQALVRLMFDGGHHLPSRSTI